MKKFPQEEFDELLKEYKALSELMLEKEKEMLKLYDSLMVNGVVTITSDKITTLKNFKEIRKTIKDLNQKMDKISNKILKMFEET